MRKTTKTTKAGFADANQVIRSAMRALRPDSMTYADVQLELAAAAKLAGAEAAAAYRKVQTMLASIAASEFFDAPRHRAISDALREITRVDASAPVSRLTTRKA